MVSAPASAFPDFSSFETEPRSIRPKKNDTSRESKNKGIQVDFDDTVKEIHQLGSTQFTGKQKKKFQAEQYKALTGRDKKKQKVPVKIVRGIKKAAFKREAKLKKEMKDSGVVTAAKKESQKILESLCESARGNMDRTVRLIVDHISGTSNGRKQGQKT